MARIFHRGEWYEELGQGSLYESEFERIFCQYVPSISPGFLAVPFKKTVYSDQSSARPDLALIRNDYLDWWVVEIEKAAHSAVSHVLPQVRTLAAASYGHSEVVYLESRSDELDGERLYDMIRGEPPRVLVVVDMPCDHWRAPLEEHSAKLSVFQLYRSGRGNFIARMNGYQPTIAPVSSSQCHLHPILNNVLVVRRPAILPATAVDAKVNILYQGRVTLWRRIATADCVLLKPLARLDLQPNTDYKLVLEAQRLLLRDSVTQGGHS